MAQTCCASDRDGLVVALCPDEIAFGQLASRATKRGMTFQKVRAAASVEALARMQNTALHQDTVLAPWCDRVLGLDHLDDDHLIDEDAEPLLCACFNCLSNIPSGGAPWQGSWRANAMDGVRKALEDGAIIFVAAAPSLEEQRNWARILLRSGCAFVQTHDGGPCANSMTCRKASPLSVI